MMDLNSHHIMWSLKMSKSIYVNWERVLDFLPMTWDHINAWVSESHLLVHCLMKGRDHGGYKEVLIK